MTAILPSEKAQKLALEWAKSLETGKNCMYGLLLCSDSTVFYAFSGQKEEEGFVPVCFDKEPFAAILKEYDARIKASSDPAALSRECWEKLLPLYSFHCFDGKVRKLNEIGSSFPSGTGDCCAPKLLSECYRRNLKPVSLAEFCFKDGAIEFHTPCDERCAPILPAITGLDFVYLDEFIAVVNKPSGLLAIEGKGLDKQDCIASRLRSFIPGCINQPCIHRLDQATSGLMVLGLTQEAHDILSSDFENRRVKKAYEALVEGKIEVESGRMELPMRLDVNNRPYQIIDTQNGKAAYTNFERIRIEKYDGRFVTRLRLIPETGRTHQLRVHCAKELMHPIVGDALYGDGNAKRLMLQAKELSFIHPITKKRMEFVLPSAF